jgi:hypothetical protein
MSEADRVFARMTTPGALPSPEDKQLLQVTSRRRGAVAGQSRMVEVVHRRSSHKASPAEPTPAASWPEGFQGRSAPTLPSAEDPVESSVYLTGRPSHARLGAAVGAPPAGRAGCQASSGQPASAAGRQAGEPAEIDRRAFADPFAADDSGTNCIRCSYLVSPAREKRGLMTCLQCR